MVILYGNNRKWMNLYDGWWTEIQGTMFSEWHGLASASWSTELQIHAGYTHQNTMPSPYQQLWLYISFLLSKCQMLCLGWLIFILTLSCQYGKTFWSPVSVIKRSQQILTGIILPPYDNVVFLPVVFPCCPDPCFQNLYVFQGTVSIPCLLWSSVP